jgi:hypothetical protein
MRRRRNAGPPSADSFDYRSGRRVRACDATEIELELDWVGDQLGGTGVLQTAHIHRSQVSADTDAQNVAVATGADSGHGRRIFAIYAPLVRRGRSCRILAGICLHGLV